LNINDENNISYIAPFDYIFTRGWKTIDACANFYDVETVCDSSTFFVNPKPKIRFPNFRIFPIPE